jgi:hypothetical protein
MRRRHRVPPGTSSFCATWRWTNDVQWLTAEDLADLIDVSRGDEAAPNPDHTQKDGTL